MTREEAIEAIKCNWPDNRYTILREALDMAVKALEDVPVVRCRECKYSSYDEIFGNRWCNSHLGCRKVKDDGYCYLGERKEGTD